VYALDPLRLVRAGDKGDIRAQAAQLADKVLIAALDIVDVLDLGGAFRAEPRYYHGCALAQITGRYGRAAELLHALYHCRPAVNLHLRTHLAQLGEVFEAVVVDALCYYAGAVCQAKRCGKLGLHVRREAGIRHGLDVDLSQPASALHRDAVLARDDGHAHLAQLCGNRLQVARDDVVYLGLPARGGCRDHIGACLYLVGAYRIGASVTAVRAVYLQGLRAGAAHVGAHGVQQVRQIDDVRLLRGVFDDRPPPDHGGGQDDMHRRADGDLVKVYARAVERAVQR